MQVITKHIEQKTATVAVQQPTHRIVVIDCSGSMGSSLPKIRTALKNKIPTMVQPNDALSIVWFSGRNEFGTLMEAVKISTLTDLSTVNTSIDRFLRTVGMTAFVQPLEEVKSLVQRVGLPSTMFFMTDGCSTGGETRQQILAASAALADVVDASTFVEFGWYADHDMLTEMAESVGGSLIQSSDFDKYVQALESDMSGVAFGKKQTIKVEAGVEYVVAPVSSGFVVAKAVNGEVSIPGECKSYTYNKFEGEVTSVTNAQDAMYLMASLVQRGKVDKAIQIAENVGDVDVYQMLQNAFSKQDYSNAVETLIEYGKGNLKLYSSAPKSKSLKVKADAYNVLQMLMDLADNPGNILHVGHPSFKYSSIGPKSEVVADANGFVPKFEATDSDMKANIAALKFDEDRPNVSILVRAEGFVELPKTELLATTKINTFIWRNFTIVKDGIINLQIMPLILTAKTHTLLKSHGVVTEDFVAGKTYLVDTKKLPIINRKMVEEVSASKLAALALGQYRMKCIQKVLNAKIKEEGLKVDKFVDVYGQEATDYLKEYGITEAGFSPKKAKVDSTDSYMAKELKVKMKGLSSIPKVEDVATAINAKKTLSLPLLYLQEGIEVADNNDVLEAKADVKAQIQRTAMEIVKTKFSVIIGKKWFSEFATMDENTITTKCPHNGNEVQVTFELKETEIS